jgi:hypothetical protein
MSLKKVNNSLISYYEIPPLHISEYYNYCLNILINLLSKTDFSLNIIFGDIPTNFNNKNKIIKIDIQCEHTLVLKGGRGVTEEIFGNTMNENNEPYLIRVDRYNYLNSIDFVIDYSFPNLFNITSNNYFNQFSKKILVVSPIIYDVNTSNNEKTDSITMFTNINNPRRDQMLNNLKKVDPKFKNITDCFSSKDITRLYKTTKILVNIHQTDHHHTFEELRVLPALTQGVLVISENVPLKDKIPYHEHIIWSDYDDIPNTLMYVQNNYEMIYNKVFNDSLFKKFELMLLNNNQEFAKIFNIENE